MALNLINASGPVPGLINNQPLITKSVFPVNDPHNPSVKLYDAYGAKPEDATRAVEAAAAALPAWKDTPYTARRAIFFKAAEIFKKRREEFVALELKETTSSVPMAQWDVHLAIEALEELGAAVSSALRSEIPPQNRPDQTAYILREPYGVVFGITPWNAPITLSNRAVASPIIAGNTVVLKTSEYSPISNVIVGEVFAEAGLPAGVLNIIHASIADTPKVVETIIAHPAVRKVNFTGSTRVGSIVGSLCGRYIKPVVLELGGAAPFIVLPDADIEHAAKNAIFGSFFHSGQTCMGTNNVIVHESIAKEFVEAVQKVLAGVQAGNDLQVHKLRGLFNDVHAKRVTDMVSDAVKKGAEVIVGDKQKAGKYEGGNVVQPIVLDHVTPEMTISKEEIFGPALAITRFSTDDEAIKIANNTEYGLSAAVHSRDVARALKVASKIEAALVHVNSFTMQDHPTTPHGGSKKSGFGRFNGFEGIREFTQIKVLTVSEIGFTPPL